MPCGAKMLFGCRGGNNETDYEDDCFRQPSSDTTTTGTKAEGSSSQGKGKQDDDNTRMKVIIKTSSSPCCANDATPCSPSSHTDTTTGCSFSSFYEDDSSSPLAVDPRPEKGKTNTPAAGGASEGSEHTERTSNRRRSSSSSGINLFSALSEHTKRYATKKSDELGSTQSEHTPSSRTNGNSGSTSRKGLARNARRGGSSIFSSSILGERNRTSTTAVHSSALGDVEHSERGSCSGTRRSCISRSLSPATTTNSSSSGARLFSVLGDNQQSNKRKMRSRSSCGGSSSSKTKTGRRSTDLSSHSDHTKSRRSKSTVCSSALSEHSSRSGRSNKRNSTSGSSRSQLRHQFAGHKSKSASNLMKSCGSDHHRHSRSGDATAPPSRRSRNGLSSSMHEGDSGNKRASISGSRPPRGAPGRCASSNLRPMASPRGLNAGDDNNEGSRASHSPGRSSSANLQSMSQARNSRAPRRSTSASHKSTSPRSLHASASKTGSSRTARAGTSKSTSPERRTTKPVGRRGASPTSVIRKALDGRSTKTDRRALLKGQRSASSRSMIAGDSTNPKRLVTQAAKAATSTDWPAKSEHIPRSRSAMVNNNDNSGSSCTCTSTGCSSPDGGNSGGVGGGRRGMLEKQRSVSARNLFASKAMYSYKYVDLEEALNLHDYVAIMREYPDSFHERTGADTSLTGWENNSSNNDSNNGNDESNNNAGAGGDQLLLEGRSRRLSFEFQKIMREFPDPFDKREESSGRAASSAEAVDTHLTGWETELCQAILGHRVNHTVNAVSPTEEQLETVPPKKPEEQGESSLEEPSSDDPVMEDLLSSTAVKDHQSPMEASVLSLISIDLLSDD